MKTTLILITIVAVVNFALALWRHDLSESIAWLCCALSFYMVSYCHSEYISKKKSNAKENL